MSPSPTSSSFQREREALSKLLTSRVFARSPNLEKILVYLCNKYFEGASHLIKEYHLATEALGRTEDFDPKRDSIVRVEMHRLRKRLKEHYEAFPDESVQILIPEKSYIPEFSFRDPVPQTAIVPARIEPAEITVRTAVEPVTPPQLRPLRMLSLFALFVAVLFGIWFWRSRQPEIRPVAVVATPDNVVWPVAAEVRLLSGRPASRYVDRFGQVWEGDHYFTGGTAVAVSNDIISRGFDNNLFSAMREGDFQYDIPLKPGSYEMLLLFAESLYGEGNPLRGGESSRVFSITANGNPILRDFDVIADASDANTVTARYFKDLSPAADGKLHLKFQGSGAGKPFVNAISIRAGSPGKMRPLRIVCRPQGIRDAAGNTWEADHFFRGGVQIVRPHGAPATDPDVFRGERYGNFSYIIPVPDGKYGAKLYFWEYWWGNDHPGRGGMGSRRFDLFVNHKLLLQDFDIIKQNPKDQVSIQTFHSLQPNAQGKLVFEFVPKVNYGMVNAIEIFDESQGAAQ